MTVPMSSFRRFRKRRTALRLARALALSLNAR
jgi:hypothetical protein